MEVSKPKWVHANVNNFWTIKVREPQFCVCYLRGNPHLWPICNLTGPLEANIVFFVMLCTMNFTLNWKLEHTVYCKLYSTLHGSLYCTLYHTLHFTYKLKWLTLYCNLYCKYQYTRTSKLLWSSSPSYWQSSGRIFGKVDVFASICQFSHSLLLHFIVYLLVVLFLFLWSLPYRTRPYRSLVGRNLAK